MNQALFCWLYGRQIPILRALSVTPLPYEFMLWGYAEQAGCLRAAHTVGFLVTNIQHEVQISACYKVRNFPENMMFLNCTVFESTVFRLLKLYFLDW